jgi:predicted nucleic acid-binding protein
MKSYVADANVLFSGIISGRDTYLKAFTNHAFYSPDFVLDEIQQYQSLLLQKTKLYLENLRFFTLQLFSKLTIVPNLLA